MVLFPETREDPKSRLPQFLDLETPARRPLAPKALHNMTSGLRDLKLQSSRILRPHYRGYLQVQESYGVDYGSLGGSTGWILPLLWVDFAGLLCFGGASYIKTH